MSRRHVPHVYAAAGAVGVLAGVWLLLGLGGVLLLAGAGLLTAGLRMEV